MNKKGMHTHFLKHYPAQPAAYIAPGDGGKVLSDFYSTLSPSPDSVVSQRFQVTNSTAPGDRFLY